MFDVGFWELALLALVGLIVLGPERLPQVARTLGLWTARARRYLRSLTDELESEIHADEMRAHFQQTRQQIESWAETDHARPSAQKQDDSNDPDPQPKE